jgi:hypothetical protein
LLLLLLQCMCLSEFGLISRRWSAGDYYISLHLHDQKGVEPVRAISNAHFLSNKLVYLVRPPSSM